MKRAFLVTAAAAGLTIASFAPLDAPADPLLANTLANASCGSGKGIAAFLGAARAYAATEPAGAPPLMPGIGSTTMRISTSNAQAQAYFDQGLRMLHGFNHAEAARAFKEAQRLDPNCAMCFWGEAFALGPNINLPMNPADNDAAFAAARTAFAKADGASEKERALIEAMLLRYTRKAPANRAHLDRAFAEEMRQVADAYADDDNVQTFAVEAMMDTQPWNYWQAGGREPYGYTAEMVKRTETVLARDPNHAGAIHLYIHVVEASTDPWRAEKYADRLARLTPAAGHLVHMPAHIYFRVGRFRESIRLNQLASRADENYMRIAQPSAMYQYGYYPHNLHFIMTSAALAGDARTALAMAPKLDEAVPIEMARQVALAQPVKAAPWFTKAQFAEPRTILDAAEPPAGVDFVTAAWRYARAMAYVRLGEFNYAKDEGAKIDALAQSGDFAAMDASGVPTKDLLKLMRTVVDGKVAMGQRRYTDAVTAFDAAHAIQEKIPYMEPPYFYYPVRQSLGAALLASGQPARAEVEFLHTLAAYPNNAYAFYGLSEARKAQGDTRGAAAARRFYNDAWAGDRRGLTLAGL